MLVKPLFENRLFTIPVQRRPRPLFVASLFQSHCFPCFLKYWWVLRSLYLWSVICLAPCLGRIPVVSVYIEHLILLEDDLGWDLEIDSLLAAVLFLQLSGRRVWTLIHDRTENSACLLSLTTWLCPFHYLRMTHRSQNAKNSHRLQLTLDSRNKRMVFYSNDRKLLGNTWIKCE